MNIVYSFENLFDLNDFIFDKQLENDFIYEEELKITVESLINSLPDSIIAALKKSDWTFEFTNTKDIEELYHINYKIDGITDYENHLVLIYANKISLYRSFFHEVGHFIDWYMDFVSQDSRWNPFFKYYYDKYNNSSLFYNLGIHSSNGNINNGEFFAEIVNIYLSYKNESIPHNFYIAKIDYEIFIDLFQYINKIIEIMKYKSIPVKLKKDTIQGEIYTPIPDMWS